MGQQPKDKQPAISIGKDGVVITAKAVFGLAAVIAVVILTVSLVIGPPPPEDEANAGVGAAEPGQQRQSAAPSQPDADVEPVEPEIWKPVVQPIALSDPNAVVSLTFDDAFAGQYKAAEILSRYGIEGTFFAPSGYIGRDSYLSLNELRTIEANGHEIGGHSVHHVDLVGTSIDETMREVCQDRRNLTEWGFSVTSFAYPFASSNPEVRKVPEACGYNSARGLGDVETENACIGCPQAETMPPAQPYLTKAPEMVTNAWTFDDLRQVVLQAEETGGWTQITFHHICDNDCTELSISPGLLEKFVSWLANRTPVGTATRTVDEVIGGQLQPLVDTSYDPAPAAGVNGINNSGLEVAGADLPRCWQASHWGDMAARFTTVSPGHAGNTAVRLQVDQLSSGAAQVIPKLDLGECAPSAVPGHSYSLRAWYTSTARTQFAVYYRTTAGTWEYWTSSPFFDPSKKYAQAVWTTPPLPEGATGLVFGLTLSQKGDLVTDDYAMYDQRGAPAPEGSGTS